MLHAGESVSTAEAGPGLLRNTDRLSQPKVDPSADAGDLNMQTWKNKCVHTWVWNI